MSNKIYLDPNSTDHLIFSIRSTADVIFDHATSTYARMAWAIWEGRSKDEYLFRLQQCTTTLKKLADQLDMLGFELSQEVEQWLQTASRFNS